MPLEDVGDARSVADVGENGDCLTCALLVAERGRDPDERCLGAVHEDERGGPERLRLHGDQRPEESRSARDRDGGTLDVVGKVLGSNAIDATAEECYQLRLVSDFEPTKLLSE
jgi:hypothetical protein